MKTVLLDGNSLTIPALNEIARQHVRIELTPQARKRIVRARRLIDEWVGSNRTVYGVTTGFGEFSNVRIDLKDIAQLQENLILSHAAGTGDPLPPEIVRAMMALRVNAIAKGHSGAKLQTVEMLVEMLQRGITPVVPSQGSVGASGDLVQLAHLVLAMMGKGRVWIHSNKRISAKPIAARTALAQVGLSPIRLEAKEGLALINGTQMMTSFAALAVHQAMALRKTADIVAGMSVEALRGSDTPFDPRIHRLRPFKGQIAVARSMKRLMRKSEIRGSHRFNDPRVQDAYSIRCIPQVHGASRDAIRYVWDVVSTEINSANDNPLIFPSGKAHLEGGNFHGQPIALAMDFLAIALAELANISERRIERLVNGSLSGLPRFLTEQGGLNSGYMIAQYTAASLVSENKVLCHPASVDSIPTSANQEDHNSMGSIAAQKAWRVLQNVQAVLGIEMLCACQGLDFTRKADRRRTIRAGEGVEAAYQYVRARIDHLDRDRILHTDIQSAGDLVRNNAVLNYVEQRIGSLD
ncbi:MAG TPA: histidine ammonia-lyase [Bacteroidota bacterium]|nr:histidine ammonia-lyase [Bacteroidota bacterium]